MAITHLTDLWPLIVQAHIRVFQTIAPAAEIKLGELVQAVQASQPRYLFHFIYIVENYNPHQLSVEAYQRRDPFDNPQLVAADFAQFMALGFIEPNGPDTFQITDKGHEVQQQRCQILNELLTKVDLMATADLKHLLTLLRRVVAATAVAPEPPAKWAMTSRWQHGLKLPQNSHPLFHFNNYRMDLGAYRDDAHLATWRDPFTISPPAWEAFSLLWAEQANTLDDLFSQLARRGYPQSTYTKALQDLQQRKWIIKEGDVYRLTETGQTIRETAERQTNTYFYMPWFTLSHQEIEELRSLLKRLA
jgi:DNA-binding MarR family transcriptional regulator